MDRLRLWWLRSSDISADQVDHLLAPDELIRRAELVSGPDRLRYTAARALTRAVLARHLGVAPADLRIDRSCHHCGRPHGKPRVAEPATPVDFSLSHDAELVVLAVSVHGPVGVDVERLHPDRTLPSGLAARVLHPAELCRSSPTLGQEALLTYWIRKESLTKATGEGIRAGFDQIEVSPPEQAPELLSWAGHEDLVPTTSMAELILPGNYLVVVSSLGHRIHRLEGMNAAPLLLNENAEAPVKD